MVSGKRFSVAGRGATSCAKIAELKTKTASPGRAQNIKLIARPDKLDCEALDHKFDLFILFP